MKPGTFPVAYTLAAMTLTTAGVLTACRADPDATPERPTAARPSSGSPSSHAGPAPVYPPTPRGEVKDTYHGIEVADPYRWLEDADSPESRSWIEAQNALTQGYLEGSPAREGIKARLTELWNYEKFGNPSKEGGRYFISRNTGLQNQSVVYTMDTLSGTMKELMDPNTLKADGTIALAGMEVSEDGRYLAYGTAEAGSDWNVWKVREIGTGKDLEDTLNWVKFSGASWLKDGSGFFYSRYDEPKREGGAGAAAEGDAKSLKDANYFQKLYFHKVGTAQGADPLVYERKDHKDWQFGGSVTDDGRYLIITISEGTDPKNRVFYKDLGDGKAPRIEESEGKDGKVVELLPDMDASYDFVGNDGPVFFFKNDLGHPRARLIAIDTASPGRDHWKELVPEAKETLVSATHVGGHFLLNYLKDARTLVRVHDTAGKHVRDVDLPGIGTASGFGGKPDDPETFYTFTGYTTPATVYRYDVTSGQSTVFKKPEVAFNPAEYTTSQVFYTSKDGTKVPMFITHKKGLVRNGKNPTILYGYGGFNIPLTPAFSVSSLVWMEMGGVYCVANLRGGGEYGEDWHQAGTKLHKQNVFDDFIGAAEWLISNGYTSTPKLGVLGGSNGGLLVGAAITQRPDLFGAAIPQVGVMDMLRFPKFTIGWAWASDYGNAEDSPEMFKYLLGYSPCHNTRPGTCYPTTMITTGDHDDRVFPGHSFKFAAALQHDQSCANPALIRIETRAGHGAGKPTGKRIEEVADQWAFFARALEMNPKMEAKGTGKPKG